jgi:hypothetical protein
MKHALIEFQDIIGYFGGRNTYYRTCLRGSSKTKTKTKKNRSKGVTVYL